MPRRLLNAITLLSLAVLAVTTVLWATSHLRHDTLFVEEKYVAGTFYRARRDELHSAGGWLWYRQLEELDLPARYVTQSEVTFDTVADGTLPWQPAPPGGLRWRRELRGVRTSGAIGTANAMRKWRTPKG